MTDNELIAVLAENMDAALASAGWPYIVVPKDQPTQQGVDDSPMVFFQKLFDQPVGSQIAKKEYSQSTGDFASSETQITITTFQISALVPQKPEDLSIPTASDVANFLKIYLESRSVIRKMHLQGANVIRVTNIRNPAFNDDRERFEMHPNFDLHIQHERTVTIPVPSATRADGYLGQGVFRVN